jgi:hypothetical protein
MFNFSLRVHRNFICFTTFQNHLLKDIKIHQLRRGIIECYSAERKTVFDLFVAELTNL